MQQHRRQRLSLCNNERGRALDGGEGARLPPPLALTPGPLGATLHLSAGRLGARGWLRQGPRAHWPEGHIEELEGSVLVAKASCEKFQKEGGRGSVLLGHVN